MHELSLAQGIVDIVQQYVPAGQAAAVTSVKVRVGRLSTVVPASLAFCFETIVAGTPLGGASLDIEQVPTACECTACRQPFETDTLEFVCPSCGSDRVRVIRGHDIQVVHFEMSEPPPEQP